jgi:hypothetical protein
MAGEVVTVVCPHCEQPLEVTYAYWPGAREEPPSEDWEFSHDCGEWTEAELTECEVRATAALVSMDLDAGLPRDFDAC